MNTDSACKRGVSPYIIFLVSAHFLEKPIILRSLLILSVCDQVCFYSVGATSVCSYNCYYTKPKLSNFWGCIENSSRVKDLKLVNTFFRPSISVHLTLQKGDAQVCHQRLNTGKNWRLI